MMRIVALRPEPGLSATIEAGSAVGLTIEGWPLFEIRPRAWDAPAGDEIDGILLGSANAVRHGGTALSCLSAAPVYAVGETTAAAAREAGFAVAMVGEGGLQQLLDALAGRELRLLRLAGRDRVPLHPPPGIELVTRIAYESAALPMPDELANALREPSLVLLHSGAAAAHFARECSRLEIDRGVVAIAALGPRIAAAAGQGWRAVRSAEVPRESALLALARDMCH